MDTLYYDGNCPLCRGEMRLLRRYNPGTLALVDLHSLGDSIARTELEQRLAVLHLRTATGQWLTGLDATLRAWSHTRYGWLLRPLRWPGIGWLADHLYSSWARRRYIKRYGCSTCR